MVQDVAVESLTGFVQSFVNVTATPSNTFKVL